MDELDSNVQLITAGVSSRNGSGGLVGARALQESLGGLFAIVDFIRKQTKPSQT